MQSETWKRRELGFSALCLHGGLGTLWSPVPPPGGACCAGSFGLEWAQSVVLPTEYHLIEVKFRYPHVREPFLWTFLVAQLVKNLPVMQEAWVRALGGEDPLEKGMAPDSSILAWESPWTEEPGRLQSTGVTKSRTRLSD